MKKGVWKYFHKGDEYGDAIEFFTDELENCIEPNPNPINSDDGCLHVYVLTKKIRITIDIFDDEN